MSDHETRVGEHSGSEMQCHVPLDALRELGLEPGDRVEWNVVDGFAVAQPSDQERRGLNNASGEDERYVCMPCRTMVPGHEGVIDVPGGTNGTVWCPWCGDKMEPYNEEHHG